MKIAVIDTTVHGQLIGGGHLIVTKLLHGLVGRGHDVHLVTADTPNEIIRRRIEETGATQHQRLWRRSSPVDDSTPVFAEWMNRLRPDVHLISASADLGWTVLPHLDPRIATVTLGHNDIETFYAPARYYRDFLTRAVGVSDEICRRYIDDCGLPQESVEWIPYGVEASEAEPAAGGAAIRLAYVGRFDKIQKRISDVVKVIRRLSGSADINFEFDLVGDGDATPMVRDSLMDEIESGRVRLHGWLDGDRVIDILRRTDVFLLASNFEGFCIALVEAMANGCCPVVTDIRSGNKQLVRDGENGFVVPVGDIDAFVDRIKLLAADRERLFAVRRAAWETGREYSVDRMVDNFVACFQRAVEDARAHPRTPDPAFPLMPSCRSKYPLWLRRIKARILATNAHE